MGVGWRTPPAPPRVGAQQGNIVLKSAYPLYSSTAVSCLSHDDLGSTALHHREPRWDRPVATLANSPTSAFTGLATMRPMKRPVRRVACRRRTTLSSRRGVDGTEGDVPCRGKTRSRSLRARGPWLDRPQHFGKRHLKNRRVARWVICPCTSLNTRRSRARTASASWMSWAVCFF